MKFTFLPTARPVSYYEILFTFCLTQLSHQIGRKMSRD